MQIAMSASLSTKPLSDDKRSWSKFQYDLLRMIASFKCERSRLIDRSIFLKADRRIGLIGFIFIADCISSQDCLGLEPGVLTGEASERF